MKNWFKIACAIVLSFFIFGNMHQYAQASNTTKSTTYYVAKTANFYDGTSSKKKQISVIDINTKLTTKTSKYNKMYEVTYKGKKGYVYASRLSTKQTKVTRYIKEKSNVYDSSKKKKLVSVDINTKLTTTSPLSDKMVEVTYNGKKGYVYTSRLSSKQTKITRYIKEKSNLYDFTKKRKIASVDINTKLTTTSPLSDKMVEVTYNGKKGYVYTSRLSSNPTEVTRYITTKSNLYDSSKKKKIASLDINTKLTTTSPLSDKMVEVTYKGKKGFVYTSRLATEGKEYTIYAAKFNSSKEPVFVPVYDEGNNILTEVPTNTKFITTSAVSETMYEVLYNDKKGFVHATDTVTKPYSFTEDYGIFHITQAQMEQLPKQQNSSQFKVPVFDQNAIRNISSAKGEDKFNNLIDLDVWDTWPLQDANGQVATYKGYNIVFGLAGDPNDADDTKVYMFYQKVGEKSIDSWKLAGRVFKDSDKFTANDPILKQETQEWSGSAMLIDGEIRLFYTSFSNHYSKQTLATAQVNVSEADDEAIKIEGVEDHKSIFDGDGKIYQNVQQFIDEGAYGTGDNHTLRDPHYIEDNGHKYLVFEANTGTEIGYHGDKSLYNKAYYGGDDNYYLETQTKLFNNGKKQLASLANGVLGIIEINDDFTLKNVLNPLITSNTVTDEIERANVFKLDGKWYLFTSSRGNKMAVDGITGEDIYMLGYVSDSLTGGYKPLNDTGLVLYMNLPKSDVTFTYAHYAIPQKLGNDVVVTSYMTNRGEHLTRRTTFAPSFLINIQGSTTTVNHDKILEQGQITYP